MDEQTRRQLCRWAEQYNTKSFIKDDPVQFPHRYKMKQDVEISAFLTAWISYGRRPNILKKAEELHQIMGASPYNWLMNNGINSFSSYKTEDPSIRDTFYRFYTYSDLESLCVRLKEIYQIHESLEDALATVPYSEPIRKLQELFSGINGIPVVNGNSACKRLAMFLRWMVRQDEIVDFGIWKSVVKPCQLLIPLDTHVYQISMELGLTSQKTASMKAAREITEALDKVFPGDPCLGDFALFGYDINK
ncbi:TIGR02757 family protein [Parabacteroides bouchesdurhonensis]|uniref:TIGR02757 family protein n=1 Tax=Parabacteroides bouchesdurhonensis TaxID=1936995 RepID=UPI000E4BE69C|nr:TIGR02757 family protein [Parabacteroides bouchesdurhonensis]RHJ94090.1 TIGR02757 family protein [Bacteroides sp. AM07-16]